MATRRIVILGAAGRDFHNFNVVYRDDPTAVVVAFTATQIPGTAGRALSGVPRLDLTTRPGSRSEFGAGLVTASAAKPVLLRNLAGGNRDMRTWSIPGTSSAVPTVARGVNPHTIGLVAGGVLAAWHLAGPVSSWPAGRRP